ncbi:PEP-CTERM sorting domain-containing protein [Leptolyngbya iicbica]|uniref:PEP-CTERM sorting domain-containing protein n=1 Tax=Leptolyngbya iicbica TaxID=3161580 RepID=UPI000AACEB8C|nr:PEP-CTERM sorting domain-containing protein [Leptolyngbya sp. LK]
MKSSLTGLTLGVALTAGLVMAGSQSAEAASVKATVTADNFYGLFYGNEDGSILNFVGRNETGGSGAPGRYNWSLPETWNFEVNNNDYLYLVTWDDASVAEAWIGEFEVDGEKLLSSAEDWEYIFNEDNPFTRAGNPVPEADELGTAISAGGWQDGTTVGKNGIRPWNTIAGIDSDADWLKTAERGADMYTIFRTKVSLTETAGVADVPEPASMLGLLAVGAVGAGSVLKKKASA